MKEIYLGLDIGTNSCGYALTDNEYNLVRIKGKDAWGVRLFDEAKSAVERRTKRATRRRLVRKKLQGNWLREIFKDEIEKVDVNFYDRLRYSNLREQDKNVKNDNLMTKYSLFDDTLERVYNDKQYYEKYKTVYHLRRELLDKPADDVRLLYLAVHSILTHRGHFLYDTDFSKNISVAEELEKLIDKFDSVEINICKENISKAVDELLVNFKQNKKQRQLKDEFLTMVNGSTKIDKTIVNALIGGKFSANDLFELEEKISVDFTSEKYEEVYGTLASNLSSDELEIVDSLQKTYSAVQLKKLLGDNEYISQAMVQKYEQHKNQLDKFKNFIKKYYPSHYNEIFKDKTNNNYAQYVYQSLVGNEKLVFNGKTTRENFYAFVTKFLKTDPEINVDIDEFNKEKDNILSEIENNNFLLKIRSFENSLLPNQLYLKELDRILQVNKQKYDFLNKVDENGLSNAEKIKQIVKFRVPYFVGPIGESKFGWATKNCNIELRPWTLNKIVDFDKAEDDFIQRMTNKCTYLPLEDVLPKESLVYSKFRVLNELNNLKIDGEPISVMLKQKIFNGLFENYKKVSIKKLKEFLVQENVIKKEDIEDVVISGIDKDFANNYASYVTLKSRFTPEFILQNFEAFELIIKYHTIISDKTRLYERMKREFKIFSEDDLKFLKSLNFSKWGTLSNKFLNKMSFIDKITGERLTILQTMWETNQNLQQVLNNTNYTIKDMLQNENKKLQKDITYEDVENMYCSPSVKRGVWQAVLIINELKQYLGRYPDKIFVEVTRTDDVKGDAGRKDSRLKSLQEKYGDKNIKDACKQYAIDYNELMNELNKTENTQLRSDKLYLYFMQLGKCAYTGNPIDLQELLYDDSKYNIDHIYPQSLIKDDSLDNRVLVETIANETKQEIYPISQVGAGYEIKQKPFWQLLLKNKLMSEEKYARLVRTTPLTSEELDGFVNKQLVSTNQQVKAVIDLLAKIYDNPRNIVYSKARFVSMFRARYDIFKSRNVNDLHHAKDAYLNVVVGNVMFNRFTEKFWLKDKEDKNGTTTSNIDKIFESRVYSNKTGDIVWNGKRDMLKVKDVCDKNDCNVSQMSYIYSNGCFYDETIYKSKKNDEKSKASILLKGDNDILSNLDYYGGYNSAKIAYFMVVEVTTNKGKKQKLIESLPIYVYYKYKNDKDKDEKIIKYLEENGDYKVDRIILDKLKIKSLLKIGKGLYSLNAKSGDVVKLQKMNQWFIKNSQIRYIKEMEKYNSLSEEIKSKLPQDENSILVSPANKKNNREIRITKQQNMIVFEEIIKQLSKGIYNLSAIVNIKEFLINKKDMFENLSPNDQVKVLINLIRYISGGFTVDLSLLGGKSTQGNVTINKNITDKDIVLVTQSATGLICKGIKL